MKVKMNKIDDRKGVWSLNVGATFTAKRSSTQEMGLYMKIDKRNGLLFKHIDGIIAVNLATGQLRCFPEGTLVKPVCAIAYVDGDDDDDEEDF